MVIECPYCEAKVEGKIHGKYSFQADGEPPASVALLECPNCNMPLLSSVEAEGVDEKTNDLRWGYPRRVWPFVERNLDYRMPEDIRSSIEEARSCYQVRAFNACAVMCGRALEGICARYGLKNKMLMGGLKELLEKDIIDKKIFSWGDELRKYRNIGAHFTNEKISKADAVDLLDFTLAICDYVFVLSQRFEEFKQRKKEKPALTKEGGI